MKEKIRELLLDEVPGVDFDSSEKLVDDGILDSLSVIKIISALSIEFGINIPYDEIKEDNFNSLDRIAAMVDRISNRK